MQVKTSHNGRNFAFDRGKPGVTLMKMMVLSVGKWWLRDCIWAHLLQMWVNFSPLCSQHIGLCTGSPEPKPWGDCLRRRWTPGTASIRLQISPPLVQNCLIFLDGGLKGLRDSWANVLVMKGKNIVPYYLVFRGPKSRELIDALLYVRTSRMMLVVNNPLPMQIVVVVAQLLSCVWLCATPWPV